MKTPSKLSLVALAAFTLGLAGRGVAQTPAFSQNQNQNQTRISATSRMTLTQFTAADQPFALRGLAGNTLRDPQQELIGNVTDFLIEPASGKLRFAVVPSGRGASGETFRLIPAAALTKASAKDEIVVKIARSQWDQVGTMVEQEVGARVTLNGEQLQRLARQFGVTAEGEGSSATNLVRTSSLLNQSLVSANEQIATIDDVLFDFARQATAAVVVPTGATAAAGQKFIVPFTQLQVATEGQGAITTSLTRADLQAAFGGLTPTGYSSADVASTAVQQALANNRALAGANVQVAPETRLVLRGTVQTQQQRTEIERTAAAAAPGVTIDNQISVRRW